MDLVSVSVRSISAAHIDSMVNGGTCSWRLTGFYGNLRSHLRSQSWLILGRLADCDDMPWVVGG